MSQSIHLVILRQYFYIFRHITIRYALVTALCIIAYTAANWRLTMKDGASTANEWVADSFLPTVFSLICVVVVMVPKLRLIGSHHDDDDTTLGYWTAGKILVFTFFMAFPAVTVQRYLREATGKLVHLQNIYEMEARPDGRFYTLHDIYIDNNYAQKKIEYQYLGKDHYGIRFTCYCLFPVYRTADDIGKQPGAWVTTNYSQEVTNPRDDQQIENIAQKFESDCSEIIRDEHFADFTYLYRMGNGNERDRYESFRPEQQLNAPILNFSVEPLSFRIDDQLFWVKTSIFLTVFFIFLFPAAVPMKDISLVFPKHNLP